MSVASWLLGWHVKPINTKVRLAAEFFPSPFFFGKGIIKKESYKERNKKKKEKERKGERKKGREKEVKKKTSIEKDLEKLKPLHTVSGNVKWYSCCRIKYNSLQKIKNKL